MGGLRGNSVAAARARPTDDGRQSTRLQVDDGGVDSSVDDGGVDSSVDDGGVDGQRLTMAE